MNYQDTTYPMEFVNSREKTEISLSLLVRKATDFLETIIPGNRFVSVRDVSQLETLTNITVSEKDRNQLPSIKPLGTVFLASIYSTAYFLNCSAFLSDTVLLTFRSCSEFCLSIDFTLPENR